MPCLSASYKSKIVHLKGQLCLIEKKGEKKRIYVNVKILILNILSFLLPSSIKLCASWQFLPSSALHSSPSFLYIFRSIHLRLCSIRRCCWVRYVFIHCECWRMQWNILNNKSVRHNNFSSLIDSAVFYCRRMASYRVESVDQRKLVF